MCRLRASSKGQCLGVPVVALAWRRRLRARVRLSLPPLNFSQQRGHCLGQLHEQLQAQAAGSILTPTNAIDQRRQGAGIELAVRNIVERTSTMSKVFSGVAPTRRRMGSAIYFLASISIIV